MTGTHSHWSNTADGSSVVHCGRPPALDRTRCTTNQTSSYTSGGMSAIMTTSSSRSTGAYATHDGASGSTASNCTTDRVLASSSISDVKSRGTRDNAVRLRHVESARVPLRHAAPSPKESKKRNQDRNDKNKGTAPLPPLPTVIGMTQRRVGSP